MSSTILLIVLLSAHITGLISEQLLKATVGGSVLFPCSLHDNGNLSRVYWQEGQQHFFQWDNGKIIKIPNNKYENRTQVFHNDFSSGNISFRLDNISPEDDQKRFFAFVKFDKQKLSEERCRSTLQVSDALNPTATFSTPPPKKGENKRINVAAIAVPVVLVILVIAGVYIYLRYRSQPQHPDLPNQPPIELHPQDRAQAEDQDQARAPDPPSEPPVEHDPHDGAQAEAEAADAPGETASLTGTPVGIRHRTKSNEDAAASPEKENLLK